MPLLFVLDNQDSALFILYVLVYILVLLPSVRVSLHVDFFFFISHAFVVRILVGSLYCATGAHFGPKMVLMSLGTRSIVVTDNSYLLC
jgi:hypothetical protein